MVKTRFPLAFLACGLGAMSHASPCFSQTVIGRVPITTDRFGFHVNAVMNGFRVYADAASRRYVDEANLGGLAATAERWANFEQRMLESTFATLIYTYQAADGVSRSRTYYAVSSSRGSTAALRDPISSDDIDDYLDPWPGEVVASLHPQPSSRVPWAVPTFRSDATWDMQDAEIKLVRSLEKDINQGVVQTRGLATVFLSRASCTACSQALNNFANAYDLSLVAKEIIASAPQAPSEIEIALRAKRVAYLATVRNALGSWATFRPVDVPRPPGNATDMCMVAPPIASYVTGFPLSARSATKEIVRAHAVLGDVGNYVLGMGDARYSRWILLDASSPYSDRDDRTLREQSSIEAYAGGLLSSPLGRTISQREFHDWKVREMGYTKARPWIDLPDVYGAPWNATRGVPSHLKAGIGWNYINGSRAVVGREYPAIGALYAVALELLHERVAATTPSAHAWLGIQKRILDAVETHPDGWNPDDGDLHYLAMIVDGAMHDWAIPLPETEPVRLPPTPFRVARMAAAYWDQGPIVVDPCLDPRQHDPVTAGVGGTDPRPLCFNDATDRAVFQWFVRELRREMGPPGVPSPHGAAHLQRMVAPFRHTIFGPESVGAASLDVAFRKEVIDMHIVNQLVAEGDMSHDASLPIIQKAVQLMTTGEQ